MVTWTVMPGGIRVVVVVVDSVLNGYQEGGQGEYGVPGGAGGAS